MRTMWEFAGFRRGGVMDEERWGMARNADAGKAVTRADVARYAGVSTAVVSYVVNDGPKRVAPDTALRVRDAIRTLDYRPNATARALKTGSSRMLGLIIPDNRNPLFAELAFAVEVEAEKYGYELALANSADNAETERKHLFNLSSRQVDGLLIAPISHDRNPEAYRSSGLPTVLIDDFGVTPEFASVDTASFQGAYDAVSHLISHGHQSIGLIIGRGYDPSLREEAWLKATRDASLQDGPIARDSFSRQGGYLGARRLLDSPSRPTAIFASSDLQAVGALRAIHELGLRVPEDLALISFDGTPESEFTWPQLSVVRQPLNEMARLAVATILQPEKPAARRTELRMELVLRQSCGCPRLPA